MAANTALVWPGQQQRLAVFQTGIYKPPRTNCTILIAVHVTDSCTEKYFYLDIRFWMKESGFFRRMLKWDFCETVDRLVCMEEVTPATFSNVRDWITRDTNLFLPRPPPDITTCSNNHDDPARPLCTACSIADIRKCMEMWMLGEYLDMPRLQNDMMASIIHQRLVLEANPVETLALGRLSACSFSHSKKLRHFMQDAYVDCRAIANQTADVWNTVWPGPFQEAFEVVHFGKFARQITEKRNRIQMDNIWPYFYAADRWEEFMVPVHQTFPDKEMALSQRGNAWGDM